MFNNIDEFYNQFPQAEWLEDDSKGNSRHSNGLGEDTEHESEWFNVDGDWISASEYE